MRTTFTALVVLILVSVASAQRLEVVGDNFHANSNVHNFAVDMALNWLETNFGITWESVTEHAPLILIGVAHYFLADFNMGFIEGEKLIEMGVSQVLGADWIEKNTNTGFRLQLED